MRSELAKVLHRAGGRPLIEHVVRACQPLKPAQLIAVVGHQAEEVGALPTALGAQTVLQQPQRGTGHAMQIARRAIRQPRETRHRPAGRRAAVCARKPWRPCSTRTAAEKPPPRFSPPRSTIPPTMAASFATPKAACIAIVEEKSATPRAARYPRNQFQHLLLHAREALAVPERAAAGKCASRALSHRRHCPASPAQRTRPRADRARPAAKFSAATRARIWRMSTAFSARASAAALMDAGVTIYLPETVVIDPESPPVPTRCIEPGVQLLGNTRIGARCTIRTGSVLHDVRVDDDAVIGAHSYSRFQLAWARKRKSGPSRACAPAPIFAQARTWEASSR